MVGYFVGIVVMVVTFVGLVCSGIDDMYEVVVVIMIMTRIVVGIDVKMYMVEEKGTDT